VKLLLERRDVDSDLPDLNGLTPLSYATSGDYFGTMRLLSKPRAFSYERLENTQVVHKTSVPALSTREEVGLAPVFKQETAIPDAGPQISDVIPVIRSDNPPSYQLEVRPLSSSMSSTSYWSTILEPSGPLKRPIASQMPSDSSKRQRFSSF